MDNQEQETITKEQYDRLRLETKLGYTRVIDILEVLIKEDFTHYGKSQVLRVVQYLCKDAIANLDRPDSDISF